MLRLKVAFILVLAIPTLGACTDAGREALVAGEAQEAAFDYDAALKSYEIAATDEGSDANAAGKAKLDTLRAKREQAEAALTKAKAQADAKDWYAAITTLEQAAEAVPNFAPVVAALENARAEREANRLGGGFREARWGMSIDAAKQAIGGSIEQEDSDFLMLRPPDGGTAKCWFYDDRLYRVEYQPGLGDDNAAEVDGIRSVMAEKYGTPTRVPNLANQMGMPLIVEDWSDRESTIRFQVVEPSAMFPRTASTVKVIYASNTITAAKKRGEHLREAATEAAALESAKQASKGRF